MTKEESEKEYKADSLVIIIKTKDDTYHQVALNKKEVALVFGLIDQMHNGVVKVLEEKINYLTF
jgi:hypothetical protein